jgi:hypothetical protein
VLVRQEVLLLRLALHQQLHRRVQVAHTEQPDTHHSWLVILQSLTKLHRYYQNQSSLNSFCARFSRIYDLEINPANTRRKLLPSRLHVPSVAPQD